MRKCLAGVRIMIGVALGWMMLTGAAAWAVDEYFNYPANYAPVSVKDFGAKSDGVADDTAAIQKALDSVPPCAGGNAARTVYFPEGVYLVSDTLAAKDPQDRTHVTYGIRMLGQGRGKSVVRLADHCPGFSNPKKGKYVVHFGNSTKAGKPNSGFNNYMIHMAVDVGRGNPGAIAIRYDVANVGKIDDVSIRGGSGDDPSGLYGLYFDTICGPGMVKNLTVEGFDTGIFFFSPQGQANNDICFEHIRLNNQRRYGVYNQHKLSAWRDLQSSNACPAVYMAEPIVAMSFFESAFRSPGPSPNAAIEAPNGGILHLRDVETNGYAKAVDLPGADNDVAAGHVDEYVLPKPFHEIPWNTPNAGSLRLFVQETPEFHTNDLSQWADATKFGAIPNDEGDDTAAFQKALDSGAFIVYCPYGRYLVKGDLVLRGALRKFDAGWSCLDGEGRIVVRDVDADAVIIENILLSAQIHIVHDSLKALAIVNHSCHGGPIETSGQARGPLFVENSGSNATIAIHGDGILAWLRQWNREIRTVDIDKATVWMFGDNVESKDRNAEVPPPRSYKSYVTPHYFVKNSILEALGCCHDLQANAHPPTDPYILNLTDSEASFIAAGSFRIGETEGASITNLIHDVKGGKTHTIQFVDRNRVPGRRIDGKFVIPLYNSSASALARYGFDKGLESDDGDAGSSAGALKVEAGAAEVASVNGRQCLALKSAGPVVAMTLPIAPQDGRRLDLQSITVDFADADAQSGPCEITVADDITGKERKVVCPKDATTSWTTAVVDLGLNDISKPVTLRITTPGNACIDNLAVHGVCGRAIASVAPGKGLEGTIQLGAANVAEAVARNAVLSFHLNNDGQALSLRELRMDASRANAREPVSLYLQTSVNGFGTWHSVDRVVVGDEKTKRYRFRLGPQFRDIRDPAVEFRLYLTGGSQGAASLRIDKIEAIGD